MLTIQDLPDDNLLQILDMCITDEEMERTAEDYVFYDSYRCRYHFRIKSNMKERITPNTYEYRNHASMKVTSAWPVHLAFRAVCRNWRRVSTMRPITLDLLVEKSNMATLSSRMTLSYPNMYVSPNLLLKQKDFWISKGENDDNAENLASFWNFKIPMKFRLFCLQWSQATKIHPCVYNKIDQLCIGYPRQRAGHLWAETGYKFAQKLNCKAIHVFSLRCRASSAMHHATAKAQKLPVLMSEAMKNFNVSCNHLVWECVPPYSGNGSNLSLCVPQTKTCVVVTSGLNFLKSTNAQAFFKPDWDFSSLPGANHKFKNGLNIRSVTEIILQHVIIGDIKKLCEFFPRLKNIRVYLGVYLQYGKTAKKQDLRNFSHAMSEAQSLGQCKVSHTRHDGTFVVY